ncbi:SDR family NAD(P)-dependent oxidoreductase [Kitasatospora misakiensis]|uniref:SDR family NAD(P)-dependent oxidoreductase n=1 Tax=Kitasatospora misakiensis TaxID=67330 RepID=A0ABW0XBY6_9ACTN
MRTALVTGAERGLGLETARALLGRGFAVVLGVFDVAEGERALGELAPFGAVHSVRLDVRDDRSIDEAFIQVAERHAALDVLVNNAGITDTASAAEVTRDQLERIFQVNAFGPALVTKAALPLLRKSSSARIVNVSSGGGSLARASAFAGSGLPALPILAYAASKTALNMITVQTDLMLRADPHLRHIKVNAASPGTSATHVSGFQGQPPAEGARVIAQLATLGDDGPSGGFFELDGPLPW